MTTPDVELLKARLTAMECRFRIASLTWLCSVAIVATLWIGVQQALSQSQTLKVRELLIVDSGGRTRIELGMSEKENPALWVYDEKGKTRLYLGLAGSGRRPQLTLSDESARLRAYLGFASSGQPTPQLTLSDELGHDRVYIGWSTRERPIMSLTDDSNKVLWSAP